MKQTGESSLDKSRSIHNHHGLVLRIDEDTVRKKDDLSSVASAMIAEPMIRGSSERAGTFELWHRSARALPGIGKLINLHESGGQTERFAPVLLPDDKRFDLLDKYGLSLLDCLSRVPGMSDVLRSYGHTEEFVRGKMSITTDHHGNRWADVIIHPAPEGAFETVMNRLTFKQPNIDKFHLAEFGAGGHLRVEMGPASYSDSRTPECCNLHTDEILFWIKSQSMNEFGYIYLSLYILGNFARYFPDLWMKAVETNHPIATASERFIEIAEARMPLCVLSEMSRSYHLPRA